jgi:M-phase inducer tyrosine phosphatase
VILTGRIRRKKATAARPSLLRHGNRFTTTSSVVSLKSQSSAGISFGRPSVAPQINLEELFGGASPKQDKTRALNSAFLQPPKPFSLESNADGSPAPLGRSVRPSIQRPKGKVRRTLSMFEHPEDVMQTERDETVPNPSPRADPGENSYLPCFNVKDDPLRRIDRATLCEVMDGQYVEHYDEYIIVDCRFEYEFQGGHISGAVNVNSIDILEEKFFSEPTENRQLIIFHCEYSAHRAPRMYVQSLSKIRSRC